MTNLQRHQQHMHPSPPPVLPDSYYLIFRYYEPLLSLFTVLEACMDPKAAHDTNGPWDPSILSPSTSPLTTLPRATEISVFQHANVLFLFALANFFVIGAVRGHARQRQQLAYSPSSLTPMLKCSSDIDTDADACIRSGTGAGFNIGTVSDTDTNTDSTPNATMQTHAVPPAAPSPSSFASSQHDEERLLRAYLCTLLFGDAVQLALALWSWGPPWGTRVGAAPGLRGGWTLRCWTFVLGALSVALPRLCWVLGVGRYVPKRRGR